MKSTATQNVAVSEYEEGYTYLTVKELNLDADGVDYMTLRVTGKKYYTGPTLGDFIFLAHTAGKDHRVTHFPEIDYQYMINLSQSCIKQLDCTLRENISWSGISYADYYREALFL